MGHLELVQPFAADGGATPRPDHEIAAQLIAEGARVLDVGCGDGALISLLAHTRGVRARGIERDRAMVQACARAGLAVVQGDAELDLADVPSGAFDYVVLSHALQHMRRPGDVLRHAARIGEHLIVTVRNAGHWRARSALFFQGRMPSWSGDLHHAWTIRDFIELARSMRLTVERGVPLARGNPGTPFAKVLWRANWFAEEAVFLLSP